MGKNYINATAESKKQIEVKVQSKVKHANLEGEKSMKGSTLSRVKFK